MYSTKRQWLVWATQVGNPCFPLSSWVTVGKSPKLSVFPFLLRRLEMIIVPTLCIVMRIK